MLCLRMPLRSLIASSPTSLFFFPRICKLLLSNHLSPPSRPPPLPRPSDQCELPYTAGTQTLTINSQDRMTVKSEFLLLLTELMHVQFETSNISRAFPFRPNIPCPGYKKPFSVIIRITYGNKLLKLQNPITFNDYSVPPIL